MGPAARSAGSPLEAVVAPPEVAMARVWAVCSRMAEMGVFFAAAAALVFGAMALR
jgi:hypothetical protein